MGDGSAIGGWILAAAVITVLAGGASTVNSNSGSSGSSSGSSSAAARSTASASRSVAPCTRVATGTTTDGANFKTYPVSASGSLDCRLVLGDSGRAVTALQQALLLCSNRAVRVDGSFTEDIRGALVRDQSRQLKVPATGIYDSATARTMHWPWYDTQTKDFTGRCGEILDRSL